MATPDFSASFPYASPRAQQVETLDLLSSNWDRKRYFICSLPVGVGKSGVAEAVASACDSAYILTSTKVLQDQYEREFGVPNLKGKGNYVCTVNREFNCDNAPCIALPDQKKTCFSRRACEYMNRRDSALTASRMLTSYSYFLPASECGPLSDSEEMMKRYKSPRRRSVVICDEAHELEDKLVEFATTLIEPRDLAEHFGVSVDPSMDFNDASDHADQIRSVWTAVASRLVHMNSLIEKAIESAGQWAGNEASKMSASAAKQIKTLAAKRDVLDRLNKRITLFVDNPDDVWIIKSVRDGQALQVTPRYPQRVFANLMAPMADKFVFLSASMGSPEEFAREFGLPLTECAYIEVDSPFDPKKSPIYPLGLFSLAYKDIDRNMDAIVEAVGDIISSHPREKGIVHAGNYKCGKAILESSAFDVRRRLIGKVGGKGLSNEEMVRQHRDRKDGSVLVSPSMYTGIDLKGDDSRFQVIVKLPWTNTSDPRVEAKMSDGDWYASDMIKKLTQASGRSTRSEDDHSVTYIIDKGFARVFNQNRHLLPSWFADRIVWA